MTQPTNTDDIRAHIYAWAKAIGLDNWLTTADYDDLARRLTAGTTTEWTWKYNNHTAAARSGPYGRAEAERAIAILRRNNSDDPVTLVRRTVTEWTPAEEQP